MVYLSYQTNLNTMNNKDSNPIEEEIERIWKFQLRFMVSLYLILMMIALLTKIDNPQAELSMFFALTITSLFAVALFSMSYAALIIDASITFEYKKATEGSLSTKSKDTKPKIPFKYKVLFVLEVSLVLAFLFAISTSTP